jgi:U3 small nucleolar RNA-associated protein 22
MSPTQIALGLLIDAESSRRIVDHGPPATSPDLAASFRSLWGDKAELRRFKDGSILESVVWGCPSPEDRHGIVKRIVRYILARHISAGVAGDIVFLTPNIMGFLAGNVGKGDAFAALGEGFEGFVRRLKDLKDMPLQISSVVPIGEGLTHTCVFAPFAQKYDQLAMQPVGSYYVPVQEVVIQLEGSGKWPDDLRAIQKIKIGLLLHMAKQLDSHGISAKVGLENSDLDIANAGYLDVTYETGYAFRARIQHDPNHREAHLLERRLKGKIRDADKIKYELALKKYQNEFMRGVSHAQVIHALRGKYYFLPYTIRLMKRWIAAHMLSEQIPWRAIELLVCYVFIHPHPWSAPASAEVGFLRTLKLLAAWNWRTEPLIVDLNGEMISSRYDELVKTFEGFRKQDMGIAHAAWTICSSYDDSGMCWTRDGPGKVVAARVTALARSAVEAISKDSGNARVRGSKICADGSKCSLHR